MVAEDEHNVHFVPKENVLFARNCQQLQYLMENYKVPDIYRRKTVARNQAILVCCAYSSYFCCV